MSRKARRNCIALLTCFMWSTAFSGTRFIGDALTSPVIAFIRVCAASCLLFVLWRSRTDRRMPNRKNILLFILSGASGFGVYLVLFSEGMKTITGAESSVVIALTPLITTLLSMIVFGERMDKVGWLTTTGAFCGVAVLMLWGSGLDIKPGMLWTVAAAFVFGIYNIINRILSRQGYSSIDIVTFSMLFSVIMLSWNIPESVRQLSDAPAVSIIVAVFMGLVPSALAYSTWGSALSMSDKTSEATTFMFVTPLFATVEGILVLNELPTVGTYLGGGIIVVMVLIFNMTRK